MKWRSTLASELFSAMRRRRLSVPSTATDLPPDAPTDRCVWQTACPQPREARRSARPLNEQQALHLISTSEIFPGQPIYELGPGERLRTVSNQQFRALALVQALESLRLLRPPVLVLGGGIGGVTAALAANAFGHETRLFEQSDRLLGPLRTARGRWIHPRLFDWPAHRWRDGNAGSPFLNWSAGQVEDVREGWLPELQTLEEGQSGIEVTIDCAVKLTLGGLDDTPRFQRAAGCAAGDLVEGTDSNGTYVLAPGLGGERTIKGIEHLPYWFGIHPEIYKARRVAIIGAGDGALRDVLSLAIGEQAWPRIVQALADQPTLDRWARGVALLPSDRQSDELSRWSPPETLLDEISHQTIECPTLIIVCRPKDRYSSRSALVLRVLVRTLEVLKKVRFEHRERIEAFNSDEGLRSSSPGEVALKVDRAIARAGPVASANHIWGEPIVQRRQDLATVLGQRPYLATMNRDHHYGVAGMFERSVELRAVDPGLQVLFEQGVMP